MFHLWYYRAKQSCFCTNDNTLISLWSLTIPSFQREDFLFFPCVFFFASCQTEIGLCKRIGFWRLRFFPRHGDTFERQDWCRVRESELVNFCADRHAVLPYLLLFFARFGLHSMRSNEGGIITEHTVCLGIGFEPWMYESCRPTIWMHDEGTIQMIRLVFCKFGNFEGRQCQFDSCSQVQRRSTFLHAV